jgi:hypothetical protein
MPFQAYHGHNLMVGYLKTFGYIGFMKDKRSGLKKLNDQSSPMVFIWYSEGAKAYLMLDLGSRRIHVSCDIIFNENRGW